MSDFIECINKDYITEADLIKAVIGKVNNLAGIRSVLVDGTGEDFIDCTNNQIPFADIFRQLFTVDSCQNAAIRLGVEDDILTGDAPCCEPLEDCKNTDIPFETIFKRLIGKSVDGEPFLRICKLEQKKS